MFGILLSAFNLVLTFVLRSALLKFVLFFGLFFVTTEFIQVLSSSGLLLCGLVFPRSVQLFGWLFCVALGLGDAFHHSSYSFYWVIYAFLPDLSCLPYYRSLDLAGLRMDLQQLPGLTCADQCLYRVDAIWEIIRGCQPGDFGSHCSGPSGCHQC
jgi:hypothetical protein